MNSFKQKVCVITGAGSGIGRALALELSRRGATLALSDINPENVQATAITCARHGVPAESFALDVSSREAVEAHASAVKERFGEVHLVINNAGVAMHRPVLETPVEDLEWLIGVNFWGVVYGSKAFLPHLVASGEGHLVNVSSVFGLIAVPGQAAYNASKFAVRGFTEALRQEMLLAGHSVGVSCVHPGGVKTNIARSAKIADGEEKQELVRAFDRMAHTSPERAARTILRGVQRKQARILIGADARVLDLMQRGLGSRYQDLAYRVARRLEPS